MNKLPNNFEFHKYGLDVRLVCEADTDFIVGLRTDPIKSRFIHKTEDDVKKHLEWFKEYKKRELDGRDYYFIYFKEGKPIGVNRIYNVFEYYGTPGSWICCSGLDMETVMATSFCLKEIVFNIIGLDLLILDVRKGNKKVQRMHKLFGAQQIGESDIDYYYAVNKKDYFENLDRFLNSLNY